MAIEGCASVLSVFNNPSSLISSPLPDLCKVLIYLQPFLLFLSLASLAHSEPSSLISAASSSQSYPLHGQEEPSIVAKPFVFETVAASYPAAGGLPMHPNFPLKEQASSLDDEQDHAVAASFSSKLTDAPIDSGAHLHNTPAPSTLQEVDSALLDHGGNHVPFIVKPLFIYEAVAASLARKANGNAMLRHENAPQAVKENTIPLLDDGVGKPIMKRKKVGAEPLFIYESVIAGTSIHSTPSSDGSLLLDNMPQEENAFLLDDGSPSPIMQKKEDSPTTSRPLFIYESVAASMHPEAHDTIRSDAQPQEENAFLLDDGSTNPIVQKKEDTPTTSRPLFIYESIAASMRPEVHDTIRTDAQAREENTFLLDDGSTNPIMQKMKDSPTTSRPLFIYESIAASMRPEVHDTIHTDAQPQEENGFLLDDGSKHADSIKKETKPLVGKTFIHESVLAQLYNSSRAVGDDWLHNSLSKETSSVLDDDGKHIVQSGLKKEELIKGRLSIGNAHTTTLSHLGMPPARGNALHQDNILLLDVHESQSDVALASTQEGKLLRDNVPQGKYAFSHGDGSKMSMSNTHGHDGKNKNWLIDTGPKEGKSQSLHDNGVKYSLNVQESKSPVATWASRLRDNVRQGKHAFLVGDGVDEHITKQNSHAPSSKDAKALLHANVPQEKHGSLVDDGGKHLDRLTQKGAATSDMDRGIRRNAANPRLVVVGDSHEPNLRMVVGDSLNRMVHRRVGDNSHQNKRDPRNIHKAEGYPANEENIKTAAGDESSNNQIQTGYNVQGNTSSEESLKMVVPDSSKSLVQEGFASNPPKENNLRTGVDVLWKKSINKDRIGMRNGRSRSCTSNPDICQKLAHAESINRIALYGQPLKPALQINRPACCSGICVDLNDNHLSCGSCGKTCGLAQTCCNGKCADLNTDAFNCGECGHVCPLQSPCQYGMCGYY